MPDAPYLWELFDYKPLTGELVWNNHPRYKAWKGRVAGSIYNNGYRTIELKKDGERLRYTAQRVVWKWMTAQDPTLWQVDHINRDKADNRFWNHRLVSPEANSDNRG